MWSKRCFCAAVLSVVSAAGFATDDNVQKMSKVSYQLSVQGWVATQTADATVAVNATLKNSGVAERKQAILKQLKSLIPNTMWHLVSFNQSQDPSGLLRLSMRANARIAQSATNNLTKQLKSISRSGEQYKLTRLVFSPSEKEVMQEQMKLRRQLYRRVVTEMNTLKAVYHQSYYPLQIDFSTNAPRPMPVMLYKAASTATNQSSSTATVANKLTVNANVVLATVPAHATA